MSLMRLAIAATSFHWAQRHRNCSLEKTTTITSPESGVASEQQLCHYLTHFRPSRDTIEKPSATRDQRHLRGVGSKTRRYCKMGVG